MKPNYIIIGAAKCATSTISTLLGRHPDVLISDPKEPHYFSKEEVRAQGLEWYEALFDTDASRSKSMRGEASNTYTMKEMYPGTADRLAAYAPEAKLIYIVRNPIRRIESYWLEVRSHGGEGVHYDFNRAVVSNRERLVDSSNYLRQLEEYRSRYPADQIRVVFYEDYAADPMRVLSEILQYLGVDPDVGLLGDLGIRYGSTKNRRVLSPTLSRLRAVPGYNRIVRLVPGNLRHKLRHTVFSKTHRGRPQWNQEAHQWVLQQIGDDSRRFLEQCGKSSDYWDLTRPDSLTAPGRTSKA